MKKSHRGVALPAVVVVIALIAIGGVVYVYKNKTPVITDTPVATSTIGTTQETNIPVTVTVDTPPSLGSQTLRIQCGLEEMRETCTVGDSTKKTCSMAMRCNTAQVNAWRSDFYFIDNGVQVKVVIDEETRLRYLYGEDGKSEKIQKWADFYPLIQPYTPNAGGMPFSATIYGDWIDKNTFKANWIKWSIG